MGIRATCISICLVLVAGELISDERDAINLVDVAQRFVRHAIRQQFEPAAALSTSDASCVRENKMVRRIHEDAGNQIYWTCADSRLEEDRAAVLFIRRPRDTTKDPSVEVVSMVRADGSWKVELARPAASQGQCEWRSKRAAPMVSMHGDGAA